MTQSHLDKPDRFRSTISSNSAATMMLVPVGGGNVQLLHHGTLFAQGVGVEPITLFITGNRTSAPIKILNIEEACLEIGVGNFIATRAKSISTPDEDSFNECDSAASFQSLKGADKNNPLDDRLNHMLLHPRTFELAGGSQLIDAGELAWKVIDSINSALDSTEEEMEELEEEKESANVLLAYLWVITKSICQTVPVTNIGDTDKALDAKCNTIRAMLSGHGTGTGNGGEGGGSAVNVTLDTGALAATQAALLTSVNALNNSLLTNDNEKKEKKSILLGMATAEDYSTGYAPRTSLALSPS